MKNKTRIKVSPHASEIDINAVVGEIAALMNAERALCADKDAEQQELDARYANPNPLLSDPYTTLGLVEIKKRIGTETVRAQLWAEANREQFAKKKSLELTHGKIGFRTGNRALHLLSRKWNWKKVLEALQNSRFSRVFVRTVLEVDKETILADRAVTAAELETVGVKVVQEDSFFVEPNLTEINPRAVAPAPAQAQAA